MFVCFNVLECLFPKTFNVNNDDSSLTHYSPLFTPKFSWTRTTTWRYHELTLNMDGFDSLFSLFLQTLRDMMGKVLNGISKNRKPKCPITYRSLMLGWLWLHFIRLHKDYEINNICTCLKLSLFIRFWSKLIVRDACERKCNLLDTMYRNFSRWNMNEGEGNQRKRKRIQRRI